VPGRVDCLLVAESTTRHISISCCQSRLLRANRETSRAHSAPTSPRQTSATIRSKPRAVRRQQPTGSLPVGCASTGREPNPLDRFERFQVYVRPPFQDFLLTQVGCIVTANHKIWRRLCWRITRQYRSRSEIVGTTNRSIDAIPLAWLRRMVSHPCDAGRLRLAMLLATEV
jgi:hypothetical protein